MAEDWTRLGELIREERVGVRRLRQPAFAAYIGIGPRTLRKLERGEAASYDDDILRAVEFAMGWAPGSVERVLSGRAPLHRDAEWNRLRRAWPDLSPDMRRFIADSAERGIHG